jgi:hypothetical protein
MYRVLEVNMYRVVKGIRGSAKAIFHPGII